MTEPTTQAKTFDDWRNLIRSEIGFQNPSPDRRAMSALREQSASFYTSDFKPWLDQVAPVDERSSKLDQEIRNALEFTYDVSYSKSSPWWSAAFAAWAMQPEPKAKIEGMIRKAKARPESFRYHALIAEICKDFGEALAANDGHAVVSQFYHEETPPKVTYSVRKADGSWLEVAKEAVVEKMCDPKGPHLLMVANHAFLETQKTDINGLADAYAKLFNHSKLTPSFVPFQGVNDPKYGDVTPRKAQPYKEPDAANNLSAWDSTNLGPSDTVMVMATYTNKNRFLNLADLFSRLDEQKAHADNPTLDRFTRLAPIARDMVENILLSVVDEKDRARIGFRRGENQQPLFFDLTQGPITLRADAADVIRRQLYRGFSKGGNDFRCAARLLTQALDVKDAEGRNLVTMPPGRTIKDLTSALSVIVFGCNELQMEPYYVACGVKVPLLTSKHDTIAVTSVAHSPDDPAVAVSGKVEYNGHHPGNLVDAILSEAHARALVYMGDAAAHGRPAIADIHRARNAAINTLELDLELAPGTTDAMVAAVKPAIEQAIRDAGLNDVSLESKPEDHGVRRYYLKASGTSGTLLAADSLTKLKTAFEMLDGETLAVSPVLLRERFGEMKGNIRTRLPGSEGFGGATLAQRLSNRGDLRHPRIALAQPPVAAR